MEGLAELFLYLVGLVLTIIGTISLIYALYSMSVPGFQTAIRFYCFLVTILCYGIAGWFFFGTFGKEIDPHVLLNRYADAYKYTRNGKTYTLELKANGSFYLDTTILGTSTGSWTPHEGDGVMIGLEKDNEILGHFRLIKRQNEDTTYLRWGLRDGEGNHPVFKKW